MRTLKTDRPTTDTYRDVSPTLNLLDPLTDFLELTSRLL
jgi:hypothetical protein